MNKILENEKLQKVWTFCKLWGGRIYKFICRIIVCATAAFVLFSFFSNVFIKIYSKLFAQDEVLFAKQYRELLRLVGYILLWHLAGIRFKIFRKLETFAMVWFGFSVSSWESKYNDASRKLLYISSCLSENICQPDIKDMLIEKGVKFENGKVIISEVKENKPESGNIK